MTSSKHADISTTDMRRSFCRTSGVNLSLSPPAPSPLTSMYLTPRRLSTVPFASPLADHLPRWASSMIDVTSAPRSWLAADASNQLPFSFLAATRGTAPCHPASAGTRHTAPPSTKSKLPTTTRSPRSVMFAAIHALRSLTSVIVSPASTTVPAGRTPAMPPDSVQPLMSTAWLFAFSTTSSSSVLAASERFAQRTDAGICASGIPAERFCA